jgi:hypothetical protein
MMTARGRPGLAEQRAAGIVASPTRDDPTGPILNGLWQFAAADSLA